MTEQEVMEAALRDSLRHAARHAPAADLTAAVTGRAHLMRTRRRATAGAATALALAVSLPVVGELLGEGHRDDRAGDRAADRVAVGPGPADVDRRIAADALLTAADVNPVGRVAGLAPFPSESLAQNRFADQCLDVLRTVDAEATQTGYWLNDTAEVSEFVKQLPDAEAAESLYASLRTLPRQCGTTFVRGRQTVHQPTAITVPDADAAMVWTIEIAPGEAGTRPEGSWDGVGIARTSNVVVVVTFGGTHDPLNGGWPDYAARTLGVALVRALR